MQRMVTRRQIAGLIAAAPLLALGGHRIFAASAPRIARLIEESQAYPKVAQRLDAISRALLGTKYVAHTLIGGPRRAEEFVVRDDAFDCVTFNETVLAIALARDTKEFEAKLRRVRYHHGNVSWRERNHYFADWCERNVENKLCRPVAVDGMVKLSKTASTEPAMGRRQWTLDVIPQKAMLAAAAKFEPGDIVGFISNRANLDYSHTGFVTFGKDKREFLLRHASSTRRRVMDEKMAGFIAANGVRYVTVLRAQESPAPARASDIPT